MKKKEKREYWEDWEEYKRDIKDVGDRLREDFSEAEIPTGRVRKSNLSIENGTSNFSTPSVRRMRDRFEDEWYLEDDDTHARIGITIALIATIALLIFLFYVLFSL